MDLPMSLIMDILIRVPPKSLLRFRCVSKSWKYLIDDSYFINLHLQHSLKNNTNLALIMRSCYIYSVDFPGLAKAVVIDHPLKRDDLGTELLGSCNGLLCLSNGEKHGRNGTIIYNPVTKKRREVPATSIEAYFFCYVHLVYGFGYDLINDDYKVVKIIQFDTDFPDLLHDSEVKVFSLKANGWRRVQDFPREYLLTYKRGWGVYVSGHLHWLVTLKPDLDGSKLIVAFDLSSEVYKDVPLPMYSADEVHLTVEVLQQCLCLLINYPTIRSEVWVMKEYGVRDSWTLLFKVERVDVGPFQYVRPIAFSEDGTKVLLEQDLTKYTWYDLQKRRTSRVNTSGMPSHPETIMLVESLVLGSRRTRHKNKRYEPEKLKNVETISLPNSSGTEVISGSRPDPGCVEMKPPIY